MRDDVSAIDVPLDRLNFFDFTSPWLERRRRSLRIVREAVLATANGTPTESKVVSGRYGSGLRHAQGEGVAALLDLLTRYTDAVEEAAA